MILLITVVSFQYSLGMVLSDSLVLESDPSFGLVEYPADISSGMIGVSSKTSLDNPFDNVFVINIDEVVDLNASHFLEYEAYGVHGKESIARSINERQSKGGYLVKLTDQWTNISESISPKWLINGDNTIKFTTHKNYAYEYQVKNVRLVKKNDDNPQTQFYINSIDCIKDNQVYISGFVSPDVLSIDLGGVSIPIHEEEFDFFYTVKPEEVNKQEIVLSFFGEDGPFIKKLQLNELVEADVILSKEEKESKVYKEFKPGEGGILNVGNASILVGPEDLAKLEVISITPLRPIDIVPLSSGMVNITSFRKGYRFLPHGLKFDNEVFIEIPFDPELIPNGYETKNIQSFYFDDKKKSWQSIQIDSVDLERNVTIIRTNHFTDYINGVIQVPESPSATAFTPTTMTDIKAADPTAGMNIISPPSANQKGDASVSYPLNIPAGRNGMTPNVNLSYSSEGGSGWLGLGWSISVPAITLDTRWGAPVFDNVYETELYMLNGQQLISDNGFRPHRHNEVINEGDLDCVTDLRPRSESSGFFYERKLGSFNKIERVGDSPLNYSWKITTADGTTHYYGNDTAIGNVQGTYSLQSNGRGIAYWALRKSVDKYGNSISYFYDLEKVSTTVEVQIPDPMNPTGPYITDTLSNDVAESGGVNLYISKINYTGFNDTEGEYDILFNSTSDTLVFDSVEFKRNDIVINAKNGFKQVDNRLLESIEIQMSTNTFREYKFGYINGQFHKTLFSSITEFVNDLEFYKHEFEYHDDLTECGSLFGEPISVILPCGLEPGSEPDEDNDGVPDNEDNCPNIYNPLQEPDCLGSACGTTDIDRDSIFDGCDNCPQLSNFDQLDVDQDARGDLCDNCPEDWNFDQLDSDNDGVGNICDLCPYNDSIQISNTTDFDNDGLGLECDNCPDDTNIDQLDFDKDGIGDACDNCPFYENNIQSDIDNDGVGDLCDNCPYLYNPSQESCQGYAQCGQQALVGTNGFNTDAVVNFITPPNVSTIYIAFNPYGNPQTFKVFKEGTLIIDGGIFNTRSYYPVDTCADFHLHDPNLSNGDFLPIVPIDPNYGPGIKFDDNFALFEVDVSQDDLIEMDINHDPSCNGPSSWELFVYCDDPASFTSPQELSRRTTLFDDDIKSDRYTKPEFEIYTVSFATNEEVKISFTDLKGHKKEISPSVKNGGITHEFIAKTGSVKVKSLNDRYSLNRVGSYVQKESQQVAPILNYALNKKAIPDFGKHIKKFYSEGKINNKSLIEECPLRLLSGSEVPDIEYMDFSAAGSALGSSKSTSVSIGGGINVGIGKKLNKKDGLVSLSGRINGSFTDNKSFVASIDMNGDGLVDLVKKEAGKINYYPHSILLSASGVQHSFATNGVQLMDLERQQFYKGYSTSIDGMIGVGAGLTEALGGQAGISASLSRTVTSVYITDANGDGLPDISVNGVIYFNTLDHFTGIPTFDQSSENTENMVVTGSGVVEVDEIDDEIPDIEWPNFDVVKVWEAIHDGEILIKNDTILEGFKISIETDNNGFYGNGDPSVVGSCRLYVGDSDTIPDTISQLPNGIPLGCISAEEVIDSCMLFPNPCIGCNNLDTSLLGGIGIGCQKCPNNLIVTDDVVDDEVFEGAALHNVYGHNLIENGSNVFYHGADGVFLGDTVASSNDFLVEIGGEFYGFIHGCENNGTSGGVYPDSIVGGASSTLRVRKGQKIYFRLHADEGYSSEEFLWDPEVVYTSISGIPIDNAEIDENGITPHRSKYSDAFLISGNLPNLLPGNRFKDNSVKVYWPAFEVSNYKDDINFSISLIEIDDDDNESVIALTQFDALRSQVNNESGNALFGSSEITFSIPSTNDPEDLKLYGIKFEVFSHSNLNLQGIKWNPLISGTVEATLPDGETIHGEQFNIAPIIEYPIYKYFTEAMDPSSIEYKWKSFNNIKESIFEGYSKFEIIPNLNWGDFQDLCPTDSERYDQEFCDMQNELYFVVTQNNKVVGKRVLLTSSENEFEYPTSLEEVPIEVDITDESSKNISIDLIGDGGYWSNVRLSILESKIDNPNLESITVASIRPKTILGSNDQLDSYKVTRKNINLLINSNTELGHFYRGWGQFMYNEDQDINENIADFDPVHGKLINTYKLGLKTTLTEEQISQLESLGENFEADPNEPNGFDPELVFDVESLSVSSTNDLSAVNLDELAGLDLNPLFITARPDRTIVESGEENPIVRESWVGFSKLNYASKFSARSLSMIEALQELAGFTELENITLMSDKGAYSLNKISKSRNVGVSASVGVTKGDYEFGAGLNKTIIAFSKNTKDYFDLNGDRYPDVINRKYIQQTLATGGLVDQGFDANWKNVGRSNNEIFGGSLSASGTYEDAAQPSGSTSGKGGIKWPKFLKNADETGANISGNYSRTKSKNQILWTDINGDGLSDRIEYIDDDTGTAYIKTSLNMGISGEDDIDFFSWGEVALNNSENNSYGLGLGLSNGKDHSISLGVSGGWSDASAEGMLVDLNGDGLLDYFYKGSDPSQSYVSYNKGNGFQKNEECEVDFDLDKNSKSSNGTLNGTFTVGIPIELLFITLKPGMSFSGLFSQSTNATLKSIEDYDGDGYPDYVEQLEKEGDFQLRVRHSNIRRTNKLKTIFTPIGGEYTIDYKHLPSTFNMPGGKWVMSDISIIDNTMVVDANNTSVEGPNTFHKHFEYHNGNQDRRERDFFGFEYVRTIDNITPGNIESPTYRQNIVKYNNESYYLNGLALESYVIKGDVTIELEDTGSDVVSTLKKEIVTIPDNQIFTKTTNTYKLYRPNTIVPSMWTIDDSVVLDKDYDIGATKGNGTAYVLQDSTKTEVFELEGQTKAIAVIESMEYDDHGRLTKVTHNGQGLNYETEIQYYQPYHIPNILSIPEQITVIDPNLLDNNGNPSVRRKRVVSELGTLGEPKHIDVYYGPGANDYSRTELVYEMNGEDYNGNLYQVIHPTDQDGNYLMQTYTYDDEVSQYILATKDEIIMGNGDDPEVYNSSATYDYEFGIMETSIDITDGEQLFVIDDFGRVESVQGPKDIAPSIIFEYPNTPENPADDPGPISAKNVSNGVTTFTRLAAITNHVDPQHANNDIKTITITNGLGEAVQVKKEIEIWNDSLNDYEEAMSVSGIVEKDVWGRAKKQYQPTLETGDPLTHDYTTFLNNVFQPGTMQAYPTTMIYDELDRPTSSISPNPNNVNGVTTTIEYGILDTLLHTKTKVPQSNGGNDIINEQFVDIDKQTIKTKFHDKTTSFEYDGIGQPTKTIDEEGNKTITTYDWAGRRTKWEHPDAGIIEYTYDNLSRIQTMSTSNLGSDFIDYKYDALGRIKSIEYPDYSSGGTNINNIYYEYWKDNVSGTEINNRGRLKRVKDASGVQELHYGKYGEVVKEIKSIVSPGNPVQTFEMDFVYDTWNRITSITYPGKTTTDIETVTYTYDRGGNLKTMSSNQNDFITDLRYDHFEQKTRCEYGNGTINNYVYEPERRFLNNMQASTASSVFMFDNTYNFDNVGNITMIQNTAGSTNSGYPAGNPSNFFDIGGDYTHNYTYDQFNRLLHADGNWNGDPNPNTGNHEKSDYSVDMEYTNMHRILKKEQDHNRDDASVLENTYENDYVYGGFDDGGNPIPPNAVNTITNSTTGDIQKFTYDSNGNMLTHINPIGESRDMLWDEKNMMKAILIGDHTFQHNVFDANGQRILKGIGNTTYVAINGNPQNPNSSIGNYTRYINGYLVVGGNNMVTKHYYNGSERLVSRLSGSVTNFVEGTDLSDPHLTTLSTNQTAELDFIETELGLNPLVVHSTPPDPNDCEVSGNCASTLYYFHPDHLGSSTFLSDATGQAYQFLLYLPWGETMAEQKAGGWATPYKYTGKELDDQIGMYDYGARFYDPSISLWTSVDPLAEAMPEWSPYNYTFDNPIRYIDPDGRAPQNGSPSPNCGWPCSVVVQRLENVYNGISDAAQSTYDYVSEKASAAGNYLKDKFYSTPSYGTPNAKDFHDSGNTAKGGYEVVTGTNENPAAGVMDTKEMEKGYNAGQVIDGPLLTPGAGGGLNKLNSGTEAFNNVVRGVVNGTKSVDKINDAYNSIDQNIDQPLKTSIDTIIDSNGDSLIRSTTVNPNEKTDFRIHTVPIDMGHLIEGN